MLNTSRFVASLVLLILTACTSINVDNRPMQTVVSGVEKELDNFYVASLACKAIDFALEIVTQPKNGDVTIRPARRKLPSAHRIGNATTNCTGKSVDSKKVYYQSNDGYVGVDSFELFMKSNRRDDTERNVRFTVDVKKP